jgi:hypothetical protein
MNTEQISAKNLQKLCKKLGHSIWINGKLIPFRLIDQLTGSYELVKREPKNAVCDNIYVKVASIQQSLF